MNLFVEELKEISEADLLTLESLMNQLTGRTVKLSREYIDGIKAEKAIVETAKLKENVMNEIIAQKGDFSNEKMEKIVVPLPPLAEQSRIVTRITQLRRLCFELRQRLAEREAVQARLAEALVQQVA